MNQRQIDKIGSVVDIASQAAGLGIGIASTVASMKDAKQRAQFQQDLELLSVEKRDSLERHLLLTNDATERLRILTDAIARIRAEEVRSKLGKKKEDKETKQILIIVGSAFALLIGVAITRKLIG
jgi:hypothetical protein